MSTGSISTEWTTTPGRTPERRQLRVLEVLDQAQTQYYHVSAIFIAGMGFFTDAYDLFCIPLVTKLLGRIYYPPNSKTNEPGVLPIGVNAAVSGVALVGTFIGQIVFGWLGDKLGRKKAYGITLAIMFLFSLASGLSLGSTPTSVITTLCFFRFWLGFGIGGDYPLSATIMAEYANINTRGAFIAAVFAMQGLGILSGGIVGLVLSRIFEDLYPAPSFQASESQHIGNSTPHAADLMWRILFMLGAIPAATTFYYRMRMPETARYTALVQGNAKKAAADMTKLLKVPALSLSETAVNIRGSAGGQGSLEYGIMSREFLRKHGIYLLATASTWFLLDIAFYSQNLFQSSIFQLIKWTPDPRSLSGLKEVYLISRAQIIIACCGTLPGYFVTVVLVDRIGRRIIQLQGFIFMSVFMFAIAIGYDTLANGEKHNVITFLVLYSFTFFFANFGPNTTTFIIPAELFPARHRATCHGISAASGKVGAIVGAFGFQYASQKTQASKAYPYPPGIGLRTTFFMLAGANIIGAAFTLLLPETKGRSLEEISGENDFDHDISNRGPKRQSDSMSIDTPEYVPLKSLPTSRSIIIGTPDNLQVSKSKFSPATTTSTGDSLQPNRSSVGTSSRG